MNLQPRRRQRACLLSALVSSGVLVPAPLKARFALAPAVTALIAARKAANAGCYAPGTNALPLANGATPALRSNHAPRASRRRHLCIYVVRVIRVHSFHGLVLDSAATVPCLHAVANLECIPAVLSVNVVNVDALDDMFDPSCASSPDSPKSTSKVASSPMLTMTPS